MLHDDVREGRLTSTAGKGMDVGRVIGAEVLELCCNASD